MTCARCNKAIPLDNLVPKNLTDGDKCYCSPKCRSIADAVDRVKWFRNRQQIRGK